MFYLACVQIVTWMDIHYVCSALLGSIQTVSYTERVILQLKSFIFTLILMFHLACVQIVTWMDIIMSALLYLDQFRM